MAIKTALELAKTYLIFKNLTDTTVAARVSNALDAATYQFEQDQRRYVKNRLIPDSFDSVSVVDLGNDKVQVELAHSIIRRLYFGYALKVSSGNYADNYEVVDIDTINNKIIIPAEYFDEVITFENYERQIYESALAWYACAFTRFTMQEIKSCTVMATSTQVGNGNITSYSTSSLAKFRNDMLQNSYDTLKRKRFPSPL